MAGKTLARASVDFTGEDARFQRVASNVARRVGSLGRRFKGLAVVVTGTFALIGGAAAGFGRAFTRLPGLVTAAFALIGAAAIRLGTIFKGLAVIAGAAFLILGIQVVRGVKGLITAAGDAEESENRFRAVFKNLADDAAAWGDATAKAIGRSKIAIRDGLATFQGFFVGMEFGRSDAAELSKAMVALSIDFASFNNISDDEALQRFISALSGSGEVLDRFGINIKQAALQQELLRMGVKGNVQSVGEQAKAVARLNIIMRAMGEQGAVGDAEKTAGSYTNTLKAFKSAVKDAAAVLGAELLPDVTTILVRMREAVPAAADFARGVIDMAKKVIGWFRAIQQGFTVAFTVMFVVADRWKDVFKFAGLAAAASIIRLKDRVVWFFTVVIPGMLRFFRDNWREIFVDTFNFTFTVLKNLATNIVDVIKNIPKLISGKVTFGELWKPLTEGFKATLKELPKIAKFEQSALAASLQGRAEELAFSLAKDIGDAVEFVREDFRNAGKELGAEVRKGAEEGAPGFIIPDVAFAGGARAEDKRKARAGRRGSQTVGLREAFNQIQAAVLGGGGDPDKRTAVATEETAENTDDLLTESKDQGDTLNDISTGIKELASGGVTAVFAP